MAVRLNGPAAAGKKSVLNFEFSDSGSSYVATLANGVLNHKAAAPVANADASIQLTRQAFLAMAFRDPSVEALVANGMIRVEGDSAALAELLGLFDSFEFWFNIVTP
jgi:alkyl sulfatase BDS1-like metallo-beta-lactamase superfamily hydrolase